MAAGKYDFTIEQGATVDFSVQYKDSGSIPIDLTGYQARMQFRPKKQKMLNSMSESKKKIET